MSGIPCDHACAVLLSIGQNVVDFVDEIFKSPAQQLVYSSTFHGIETHNMPKVQYDGVVRDVIGNVFFSLSHPALKGLLEDQEKSVLSHNFKISGCLLLRMQYGWAQ